MRGFEDEGKGRSDIDGVVMYEVLKNIKLLCLIFFKIIFLLFLRI